MITKDVFYAGVNDKEIDLFEGQYVVPNGMAYNSYVIADEKIAVTDTVDARFVAQWLGNIEKILGAKSPDYLIVHHMEPDHSAGIAAFAEKYPNSTIVASARAFVMMQQFFGNDFEKRRLVVADGSTLCLGKHLLTFVAAPMVHWPEVVVSYDSHDKILFSADGFGKFGATDADEDWDCEARRYYFGIVGKYGAQVTALLNKAAALDVNIICPLHGPVLKENIAYYLGKYKIWASYQPENTGVTIAYTSVYGHTKEAALLLAEKLQQKGVKNSVFDLARDDMAEAVEDAFRYDRLVLATTTYNGEIFPYMREFVNHLVERGYKNRVIGLIENGSWAPVAAKVIKDAMAKCNVTFAQNIVTLKSALSEESRKALNSLAEELAK